MNPIRIDESTLNALLDASAVLVAARDTIAAVPCWNRNRNRKPNREERPARPWEWLEQTD